MILTCTNPLRGILPLLLRKGVDRCVRNLPLPFRRGEGRGEGSVPSQSSTCTRALNSPWSPAQSPPRLHTLL